MKKTTGYTTVAITSTNSTLGKTWKERYRNISRNILEIY